MRTILGCGLAVVLVLGATAAAGAKADPDAKKLVGKWEAKDLPNGGSLVLEFTKEGKLTGTMTANGKSETKTGTYSLKGDKLTVSITGEKEYPVTIGKLTDDVLEVKGDSNMTIAFKKVKAN